MKIRSAIAVAMTTIAVAAGAMGTQEAVAAPAAPHISAASTSYCLDGSVSQGVRLAPCADGSPYQIWHHSGGLLYNAEYGDSVCLDGSLSQGVRMVTCSGSKYQKWNLNTSTGQEVNGAYADECLDISISQGVRLNACDASSPYQQVWL
jgi:hypothetical protein